MHTATAEIWNKLPLLTLRRRQNRRLAFLAGVAFISPYSYSWTTYGLRRYGVTLFDQDNFVLPLGQRKAPPERGQGQGGMI